jgi:hypothetical protein
MPAISFLVPLFPCNLVLLFGTDVQLDGLVTAGTTYSG